MTFFQYIMQFSDLFNLLAVLVFFVYYKRCSLAARLIVMHVVLLLVINSFATVLARQTVNNYFLLHILTFLDLFIISTFYFYIIKFKSLTQKIIGWLMVALLGFCLYDSFWISSIGRANIYSITGASTFKIFLIVHFFIARIQNIGVAEKNPLPQRELALYDIFSISLLLYTASSMFFFLFLNQIVKAGITDKIIFVNAFFYMISNGLTFYGLWRYFRNYPIEE